MKPVIIKIKGEDIRMGRLVERKQMTTIFGYDPKADKTVPNFEYKFQEFHMSASRERHYHNTCSSWMIDSKLFYEQLAGIPDLYFIVISDVTTGNFYKVPIEAWENLGFKARRKYERTSFCLPVTYFSIFNAKMVKIQDMHVKAKRYLCNI